MKKIAIVSCNKWKNKIEEDKLLQNALIQSGYNADIISWEDADVNYDEYIALVLRSVWGYQNNYLEFKIWLNMIKQSQILLLNSPELVSNNIRKDKQFELLAKYEIPIISTEFIYKLEDLFNDIKFDEKKPKVLKPIISGSGENTFLVDSSESLYTDKIIKPFEKIIKCEDNGIMLQPYIGEVKNGEFACIYIDGVNTHNMMRYPGIFANRKKPVYLTNIPEAVKKLADKVSKIEEYSNHLYMRIDIVLHNNKPMIMEVELAEPDLLFKFIPDEKLKNESVNHFCKKINKENRKMKTLLYFEEYESNLSHALLKRSDINPIIIRTNKNMKFFSEEYLNRTKNIPNYIIDYYNDMDDEVSKFKSWLNDSKIMNIDYFLNDSEYYLEFANKFANKLGLYSLTDKQIKWVRDKVDMKKRFREIGIDTVDFSEVNSKEELKRCFNQNGCKKIIFKPRRGMNSIDTYIISSLEDVENLDINIVEGKYMIEDFCYDHEWSIESLVQNGIVLDSYLTYIPNPTLWASISNDLNCHMTVPKIPSYFKFVPKNFIQQIVTGMNLKDGAMTIEVFIDKNGNIKASELGWRLPGCQATLNHSYSYGIDIYNLLLDIAIHKPVKLSYRQPIISVGDLYLPNKEGIISKLTPLEELLQMDGVISGEMFAKVGEYQKKRRVGNDSSGWVQVTGRNEQETLQKMQNIFNEFQIETEKERGRTYAKKI